MNLEITVEKAYNRWILPDAYSIEQKRRINIKNRNIKIQKIMNKINGNTNITNT